MFSLKSYDKLLESINTINGFYRNVIKDEEIRMAHNKFIRSEDSHIVRGSIAARTKAIITEEEDTRIKEKASKINREVILSWK
jgi:hypothetical protein